MGVGVGGRSIKYFLKKCVQMGYLHENIARDVKRIKPEKRIPFFFSEEDLAKIMSSGETLYYKKIYLFLLLSGMRCRGAVQFEA